MGFNPGLLDFVIECVHDYGLLPGSAILDVGTSELFCAGDPLSLNRFLDHFGAALYGDVDLDRMAKRGLAADLLTRAGFRYTAIDFTEYPHTLRVDLNTDTLPRGHQGRYQFVANSGTSEHILNQYNVFNVVHEATAVGGLMYHGVPMAGEFSHGVINYNPKFFWALAEANEYEIVKFWGWASEAAVALEESIDRALHFNQHLVAQEAYLHVLLRRTSRHSFRGLVDPAFK